MKGQRKGLVRLGDGSLELWHKTLMRKLMQVQTSTAARSETILWRKGGWACNKWVKLTRLIRWNAKQRISVERDFANVCDGRGPKAPRSRSRQEVNERTEWVYLQVEADCAYCHRYGNGKDHCWKKQRWTQVCGYCHQRGHKENNCWAKNLDEGNGACTTWKCQNLKKGWGEGERRGPEEVASAVQRGCDGELFAKKRDMRGKNL